MASKEYKGQQATVRYDLPRCFHAAECVKGAPNVFDPKGKPWVQPDGASVDELVAVVDRCPTGALSVVDADGASLLPTPTTNSIRIEADGPLIARGSLTVRRMDGDAIVSDTRLALCRCGASENKPFCDNSHAKAGFSDPGGLGRTAGAEGAAAGPLEIQTAPNGPLLTGGPVTLHGADGEVRLTKAALCRCGLSQNKPYCDGSHSTGGFRAD